MKKRAVCILSGGMDSTLVCCMAINEGYDVIAVHFNYGQRTQNRELKAFRDICENLGIKKKYEIDLPFFTQIGASALIDKSIDVPTNDMLNTKEEPSTYVPFRNGIFISIATAIAEKEEATSLMIGVVLEDRSNYPDCTYEFIKSITKSINIGTKKRTKIEIKMPLVNLLKSEIVLKAINLNAPLELTWSCYKEEQEACGVCDSCILRLNGFKNANIKDKIPYKNKVVGS